MITLFLRQLSGEYHHCSTLHPIEKEIIAAINGFIVMIKRDYNSYFINHYGCAYHSIKTVWPLLFKLMKCSIYFILFSESITTSKAIPFFVFKSKY